MGKTLQLLAYTGENFIADLGTLVIWIVSIAGALMTLYAVYIGYLFATASDETKRKAAKERLIKTIASSLIVIALASILSVIKVTFDTPGGSYGTEINNKISKLTYTSTPTLTLDNVNVNYHGGGNNTWSDWECPGGEFTISSNFLVNEKGKKVDPDGTAVVFKTTYSVSTAPEAKWGGYIKYKTAKEGLARFAFSFKHNGEGNEIFKCMTFEKNNYTYTGFRLFLPADYTHTTDDEKEVTEHITIAIDVSVRVSGSAASKIILDPVA